MRRSFEAQLPTLGVGITYSAVLDPLFAEYPNLFDTIELEPQTTWLRTKTGTEKYRISEPVLEHIASLPGRKIIHSVGTPVGGTVRPEPEQLKLLKQTIEFLDAPWASDHLSFNSVAEFHTGFFLPPRQTMESIEVICTAIRDLQIALPVPFAVETGVNYLRRRSDEMPDGEFVRTVVETADCGLLLDLHNIFANAMNGRQTVEEFISQIPLDRVWEIHIAGGFEMDDFWLDAHSGAIPDHLFEIAKAIIPDLPNLKAIIFEVFPAYVPLWGLEGVRAEIERIHELWSFRKTDFAKNYKTELFKPEGPIEVEQNFSPTAWENTLGKLVIGHELGNEFEEELANDPGVTIMKRLVNEFRGSMVVNVFRLTSRYLMLTLGKDVFVTLLKDFWEKHPPELYASDEGEKFADYLEKLDLKVPQLAKLLEFERAVLATLLDDQTRLVKFEFDPLPLLRGLAEGRLPDMVSPKGSFEIEITADGPISMNGANSNDLQQLFPFH